MRWVNDPVTPCHAKTSQVLAQIGFRRSDPVTRFLRINSGVISKPYALSTNQDSQLYIFQQQAQQPELQRTNSSNYTETAK